MSSLNRTSFPCSSLEKEEKKKEEEGEERKKRGAGRGVQGHDHLRHQSVGGLEESKVRMDAEKRQFIIIITEGRWGVRAGPIQFAVRV